MDDKKELIKKLKNIKNEILEIRENIYDYIDLNGRNIATIINFLQEQENNFEFTISDLECEEEIIIEDEDMETQD